MCKLKIQYIIIHVMILNNIHRMHEFPLITNAIKLQRIHYVNFKMLRSKITCKIQNVYCSHTNHMLHYIL